MPELPAEVRIGPGVGEDAAAIALTGFEDGWLVATTDPITLTGSDIGRYAVAINANDLAAMGVAPRWFLSTLLLPEGTRESEVRALFAETSAALEELGVAWIGGHTEVTSAVAQPVVVGQMLGVAEAGRVLSSAGLEPGDVLVQVGEVPIEAAAVLAAECAALLGDVLPEQVERAREAVASPGILVVEAGLLAAELGAVAAHDPTEGGLATGIRELAEASGVRLELDEDAVAWFEPGVAVCRAVGADPWGALASGTLLAGFRPEDVARTLEGFEQRGFVASAVGAASAGEGVQFSTGDVLPSFERDEVARVLSELGSAKP